MAETLKHQIKRNTAQRREKANTSIKVASDETSHQFNVMSDLIISNDLLPIEPAESAASNPSDHQEHHCLSGVEQSPAIETDFVMKYLDFVFPALFPFYRPGLFETGHSWLLLLLRKSKIAYHSTVSLSCYFFTMALTDAESGGEHSDCKYRRWQEVEEQTDKCFESIRADVLALSLHSEGSLSTQLERVEIMESVMQVLIFESALGKSAPWNTHLPAAYALFEEIMASALSHQEQDESKFASVLLNIGQPLWTKPGENNHIWSPDQAGFRFCAGFLLFVDVMGSTATQTSPRLMKHHSDVLAPVDEGTSIPSDAQVRLSSIVGCRNWVVRCIAETSALDAWKRGQMETNSLSKVDLVDRATGIANSLRSGILNIQDGLMAAPLYRRAPFDMPAGPPASASSTSTLIWAHAAQLYLTVVISGWQLSNTDIRTNVARIIELLGTVPPYQLRALAWPLCVAGCLALESEETSFMTLFSSLGKVYKAGVLDDALQILKRVWQIRPTLQANSWNLASCFGVLGAPVLIA
ncbi:hypothetical protein EJ04DRAFT_516524 [Polyplosphaeria fusca]|uniref:Uncharacterized protein n=1 Tax=Polyplosphaeria fusca TaxID=682080 RepID=A0A9P4UX58_9PLEO|nr:hypothetical protein EJ04DRAFT_516524 [Polyplosphaeria fusca]